MYRTDVKKQNGGKHARYESHNRDGKQKMIMNHDHEFKSDDFNSIELHTHFQASSWARANNKEIILSSTEQKIKLLIKQYLLQKFEIAEKNSKS